MDGAIIRTIIHIMIIIQMLLPLIPISNTNKCKFCFFFKKNGIISFGSLWGRIAKTFCLILGKKEKKYGLVGIWTHDQ